MTTKNISYESIVQNCCSDLVKIFYDSIGEIKWKCAYVDVRWTPTSGTRISKNRVLTLEDVVITLSNTGFEDTPNGLERKLHEAWRSQLINDKPWYGIKVIINPDQTVDVNYNYDDQCAGDSSFFDE
jgi:hypothetical protein